MTGANQRANSSISTIDNPPRPHRLESSASSYQERKSMKKPKIEKLRTSLDTHSHSSAAGAWQMSAESDHRHRTRTPGVHLGRAAGAPAAWIRAATRRAAPRAPPPDRPSIAAAAESEPWRAEPCLSGAEISCLVRHHPLRPMSEPG